MQSVWTNAREETNSASRTTTLSLVTTSHMTRLFCVLVGPYHRQGSIHTTGPSSYPLPGQVNPSPSQPRPSFPSA